MHGYKVTISTELGRTSYFAIARHWYECFLQAVNENGVRAIICVRPLP